MRPRRPALQDTSRKCLHLIPLLSCSSALLFATGCYQLLCHQSLPTFVSVQRRGRGYSPSRLASFQQLTNCSRFLPSHNSLCFHALTNYPICNPFVLITLQQYPGVGGIMPSFRHYFSSQVPSSAMTSDSLLSRVTSHESPVTPFVLLHALSRGATIAPLLGPRIRAKYWETKPLPSVSKEGERTSGSGNSSRRDPAGGRS